LQIHNFEKILNVYIFKLKVSYKIAMYFFLSCAVIIKNIPMYK